MADLLDCRRVASSSARVGMASAQASRDATIAPAALACSRDPDRVPAGQQAVHQRAAEGVAGAEAADDLDRVRRHDVAPVAGGDEHALAAHLDQRQLDTRGRAAGVAASSGSLVPTATSTSARLPTATVTWSSIASYSRAGLLGRRPEHRPPVEVEHRVPARAAASGRPRCSSIVELVLRAGSTLDAGPGHPEAPARRARRPTARRRR